MVGRQTDSLIGELWVSMRDHISKDKMDDT